jgi:hypothetical protein
MLIFLLIILQHKIKPQVTRVRNKKNKKHSDVTL